MVICTDCIVVVVVNWHRSVYSGSSVVVVVAGKLIKALYSCLSRWLAG